MASSSSASSTTPSIAIGIDFGTTFCCVAVYHPFAKKPEVILSDYQTNTTPSYVAYNNANADSDSERNLDECSCSDEDNEGVFAGETAKQEAHENPENTFFDIKRLIGRSFYDPNIQKYKQLWPFHLVNMTGLVGVKVDGGEKLPQEIASELIRHLKKTSEDYLRSPINSAVVTIPVYYNEMQRDLTRGACEAAGLTRVHFIPEPVAAAVAYGLKSPIRSHETKTCLIYDLGGGTFDVTVFRLDASNQVEIRATGGDDHLGGEDFNDLLTEFCISEFKRVYSVDLAEGKTSDDAEVRKKVAKKLRRIRNECERQKCFLASLTSVVVSLDKIYENLDLLVTVTRSKFEDLIATLLGRSISILDETLKRSGFDKEDVNDVILVGGSSRIAKVQEMVQEFFEGKQIRRTLDVDEAVACGAAIHAYNIFKQKEAPFSVVTLMKQAQAQTESQPLGTFSLVEVPGAAAHPKTKTINGFPARSLHAAVAVEGLIYSFGGFNLPGHPTYAWDSPLDILVLNVNERQLQWKLLSIEKNKFSPNQRYGHTAVAFHEYVVIFGGYDTTKKEKSNSVYRFNTETLTWDKPEVNGNIPKARYGHSCAKIKNYMVIYGGRNEGCKLRAELHALDLENFHWSTIETKGISPSLRRGHSATVFDDRFMLIFGGWDCKQRQNVNSIMSFDYTTNTWSIPNTSGSPPQSRSDHCAFVHKGCMCIFGGSPDDYSYFNDFVSYNPETFEWKNVTPIGDSPSPRESAGCVSLNDQIFIFGGQEGTFKFLGDTCVFKI